MTLYNKNQPCQALSNLLQLLLTKPWLSTPALALKWLQSLKGNPKSLRYHTLTLTLTPFVNLHLPEKFFNPRLLHHVATFFLYPNPC